MKKFKILPSILMLVMCVGVLAVGIYAVGPSQNNVVGTISVKASGVGVTVSVYKDSVLPANLIDSDTSRKDTTINVNSFELDTSNASTAGEVPTLKLIVVFSTTNSESLIVDTETIEYFNGLTETTNKTIKDVMMVSKVHTPGQTDSATGLASFTKGKDYQIECNFKVTEIQDEACSVSFDLEFLVSKASEYVQQRFSSTSASTSSNDKSGRVGINGVDYLYFGEYPQTRLLDSTIINRLTSTGEFFEAFDIAGGNEIYRDSTTGNRYVKIADVQENVGDGQESTGEEGYFLIEPIRWSILSQENGEANLLCDIEVEYVEYKKNTNYTYATGTVLNKNGNETTVMEYFATDGNGNLITNKNGYNVYLNDYEYSDLRAYLNDTFYNQAFKSYEKELILKTTVENSVSANPYAFADTEDYIFAPRAVELCGYNFADDGAVVDLGRLRKVSDYARATGAYVMPESDVWGWVSYASGEEFPETKEGVLNFLVHSGEVETIEQANEYYDEYITYFGVFWLRDSDWYEGNLVAYCDGGLYSDYIGGTEGPGCVPALRLSLVG